MKNKLISVVVIIYNIEKYLDDCIESIVNQSYENLEIILVDDGSTDVLDLNMITRLIDYIEKKKCDLIFCKHQMISEKDHFVKKNYTEEKIDIVFPEQAHLKLLNHIEYEAVWNGIYKTELIKNIFSQLEKRMRMFFGSIRQSTNVIK